MKDNWRIVNLLSVKTFWRVGNKHSFRYVFCSHSKVEFTPIFVHSHAQRVPASETIFHGQNRPEDDWIPTYKGLKPENKTRLWVQSYFKDLFYWTCLKLSLKLTSILQKCSTKRSFCGGFLELIMISTFSEWIIVCKKGIKGQNVLFESKCWKWPHLYREAEKKLLAYFRPFRKEKKKTLKCLNASRWCSSCLFKMRCHRWLPVQTKTFRKANTVVQKPERWTQKLSIFGGQGGGKEQMEQI